MPQEIQYPLYVFDIPLLFTSLSSAPLRLCERSSPIAIGTQCVLYDAEARLAMQAATILMSS